MAQVAYNEVCAGRPGAADGNNHGQFHFYAPNWGFTHLDENGDVIADDIIAATMADATREWCTDDARCIGYYTSDKWTNVFFASKAECLTVCNANPTRIVHAGMTISAFCDQVCIDRHTAEGPFDADADLPCHSGSYGNEKTFMKVGPSTNAPTDAPTGDAPTDKPTEAPTDATPAASLTRYINRFGLTILYRT